MFLKAHTGSKLRNNLDSRRADPNHGNLFVGEIV